MGRWTIFQGGQDARRNNDSGDSGSDDLGSKGEPCLYAVLNLDTGAKPKDIRKAYMELARRHHPDKKITANPQGMDTTPDLLSDHDMFSLIARAYEVLIDPTKRTMYDILNGHGDEETYEKFMDMKRKDAERAVQLMKVSFDVKRKFELARGGLVIDDSVYGPREIVENGSLEDLVMLKCVVNVTRQLQCAVNKSRLILPGGESKHCVLDGVYDPAPGEEKLLWVRYYFRGKLHRVIIEDTQRLLMPLKSHCVDSNTHRTKQHRQFLRQAKRKKKSEFLFKLGVLSVGILFTGTISLGVYSILHHSSLSFKVLNSFTRTSFRLIDRQR